MENEFDSIRALVSGTEPDIFTPNGARLLVSKKQKSPYDNMFENLETRDFISNTKDSKYLTIWDNPNNPNIEEFKAQRQPWEDKLAAGIGRVGLKVSAEIAKMPGVIGGITVGGLGQLSDLATGKDETDFMQTAFNNSWIKSIEHGEEFVKEEFLPVYVKKSIREGNFWDNITSMDFWATEGADGLGYIISMLAPGQAITKLGIGSKLLGANKLTKMAAKTNEAQRNLKRLTDLGINAKNADLATATIANTLFEAGAEARGAMDSYMSDLDRRRLLHELNPDYITEEEYKKLSEKSSEVGRDVFLANSAILIGPNAVMTKMLWGRATNKASKVGVSNGAITKAVVPSLKNRAKELVKDVAKAGAREGFWEEGLQTTAENYFVAKGLGKNQGTFAEAYGDMLLSTEGQKAIFLGAFFGGGMQGYSGAASRKADREVTNELVDIANNTLTDFANVLTEDAYIKNEDGSVKINEVTKKPSLDFDKIGKKITSSSRIEKLSAQFDIAVQRGDIKKIEDIRDMISTHVIAPFVVNESLGLDVLRKSLEASSELSKVAETHGYDNTAFIDKTIKKAEYLRGKYKIFSENTTDVFNLKDIESTNEQYNAFRNELVNNYLSNNATIFTENDKLRRLSEVYEQLAEENEESTEELSTNRALRRTLFSKDSRMKPIYNDMVKARVNIKKAKSNLNKLWDSKTVREEFKQQVKESNELAEALENEKKVDDTLNSIKSAKTIEELDSIDTLKESLANPVIEEAKEEQRAIIKKEEAEAIKAAKEAQNAANTEQATNHNLAINALQNYNVGEKVTIPGTIKSENFRGMTGTVTKVTDEKVTIELDDNKGHITIGIEHFIGNSPMGEITSSEGGINNTPQGPTTSKDNSSKVFDTSNGSRIIITNNTADGSKMFDNIPDEAVEFERTPRDKKGEVLGVEINTDKTTNDNQSEIAKKADIERRRQEESNNKAQEIVNRGEVKKEFRPITKEDKNNKVDFNSLFSNISKVLTGEIKSEIEDANKILKQYLKEIHPDKFQEENQKLIAEIFTTAMIIVGKKGDVNKLNELYNQYKEINAKYDAELDALTDTTPKVTSNYFSINQNKALSMLDAKDFSDLEFLINHLPLNVKLTDGISVPLATLPAPITTEEKKNGKIDNQKIFNNSSKKLRSAIIKELAINKTPIENIRVVIEGQANGDLQLAPQVSKGVEAENSIVNLHKYSGDISKVKSSDIYMVDEFNKLINNDGDTLSTTRDLSPERGLAAGEIYLKINTASGKSFPLKLNVKRISEQEADILYQLYAYRFNDFEGGKLKPDVEGKLTRISELPEEFQTLLKSTFKQELNLFKKAYDDITIKDITDFLIYDATDNIKSQVRFNNGKLLVANKVFTKELFETEESKNAFIYTLVNHKRHQIKYKRHQGDINDLNIEESRPYLEYLLNNNILNTNAVAGRDRNGNFYPTFAGKTSIYLDSFNVLVNGKPSKFNLNRPKNYNRNLIGTSSNLKKLLPSLFSNTFTLNSDGSLYIDNNGKFYKRVSDLKDSNINNESVIIKNASKRGNTVDELTRLFFTKSISVEDFTKQGKRILNEQNKLKPGTTVKITDSYYTQLYNILEQYKEYFNNNNFTVYANTPSIGGTIGSKGNRAGTIDLLLYNNNTSTYYILDLKTSTSNRIDEYNNGDKWNYKGKDEIQQNAYRELFQQVTGVKVEKLFIMPLTSKEDSKSTNDYVYSDISISHKDMIFPVNMDKDIYELLGIKPTVTNQAPVVKNNNEGIDEETKKLNDLWDAFDTDDLSVIEQFEKKILTNTNTNTIKVEPKVKVNKETPAKNSTVSPDISDKLENNIREAVRSGDVSMSHAYKGVNYVIFSPSLYIVDKSKGKVVSDLKTIQAVIKDYNDNVSEIDGLEVTPEQVTTLWSKRIKDINDSIKKDESTPVINTLPKVSEADVNKAIRSIIVNYGKVVSIKDIQSIIDDKSIGHVEKLEKVFNLLVDKGVSRKEIKNICKL